MFFSSDGKSGLRIGEHFETMLTKLKAAKHVVAVVSLQSRCSTAVQTEMVLANHQKNLLPVVVRQAYRNLLTWPFERLQTLSLDSTDDIRQLLDQLSKIAGRATQQTDRTVQRCKELARFARRTCPDPARRKRWFRSAMAAGVLGLLVVAYCFGRLSAGPRSYTIGREPLTIDGTSIRLVHETTFPRKLLSTRLHEIWSELGRQATRQESYKLFNDVLEDTKSIWGLSDENLSKLKKIAEKWDGNDSRIPSGQDKKCNDLNDIDKEWCAAVEDLLPGKIELFDDTKFAVISMGDPAQFKVLTLGNTVPNRPTWRVVNIGGVTIQVGE